MDNFQVFGLLNCSYLILLFNAYNVFRINEEVQLAKRTNNKVIERLQKIRFKMPLFKNKHDKLYANRRKNGINGI